MTPSKHSTITAFLDESGDEGNFLDEFHNEIRGSSQYMTISGILIDSSNIPRLEKQYQKIIKKYFLDAGIILSLNFKLHCTKIKKPHVFPYNEIGKQKCKELLSEIYKTLNSFDCNYFAVSVDIKNYCIKYGSNAINSKAFAIFIGYEMFRKMEQKIGMRFTIIYEEFNRMKKSISDAHKQLSSHKTFPNPQGLGNITNYITSGSPQRYPILQFSDFIANAVFSKLTEKQKEAQILPREKFSININGNVFHNYREV